MSEPRIVTSQEAQDAVRIGWAAPSPEWIDLVHTVATEPDRTRAAVVKALRDEADRRRSLADSEENVTARTIQLVVAGAFDRSADAIENGADY